VLHLVAHGREADRDAVNLLLAGRQTPDVLRPIL
jgi:hypothetical protein